MSADEEIAPAIAKGCASIVATSLALIALFYLAIRWIAR